MRVLLATSPHVRHPAVLQNEFSVGQEVMYSFVPVGLLALIASTRASVGITPELFDLNRRILDGSIRLGGKFYDMAAEMLCSTSPDVLGFMTECDSYHHVLQILERANRILPSCRLVLGGPHASAVARASMERRPFVDAVVVGEGERSFAQLLQAYGSEDLRSIPGVMRRSADGGIVDGGAAVLMNSLDDLPIPAYDCYQPDPGEEIFVEVGRGCPFRCTFCSTAPFWRRRHRVKTPQRILAEMALVNRLYGARRLHFTHDLLTADRHWVAALCRSFIDSGTKSKWTCSARTDTVDDELLDLMARAGCNAIYFGIESGSSRILTEIDKQIPLESSLKVLERCKLHGITPNAGFIVGFPSEDWHSMNDTFEGYTRALEAGCRPTHIFGFCPFRQSAMFAELSALECDGHFLDLPLGPQLDEENRALIGSDSELFGSYFHPRSDLRPWLRGVDEFSCLVDATLVPSMLIAKRERGMLNLYRKWIAWCDEHNSKTDVPAWRQHYGSPVQFCLFLAELLSKSNDVEPYVKEVLEVIRTNMEMALISSARLPTSMASYRSFAPGQHVEVAWDDHLAVGGVLARRRLEWDVTALLGDVSPGMNMVALPGPLYLVWQADSRGQIRLMSVDAFLFATLETLERETRTPAELMEGWLDSPYRTPSSCVDCAQVMKDLGQARETGLISIYADENQ